MTNLPSNKPDRGTGHIDLWKSSHMTVHTIGRHYNQWYTGLDQYFFPLCILVDYLHFGVMDFHHRHKSGWGNQCNHPDNWCYRDNLKKWDICVGIFANNETIYAIIESSSTLNKTISIRARYVAFNVFHLALVFTSCSDIFIPEIQ